MPSAIDIPDEEAVQLADAPLPGALDVVQPRQTGLPVDTLASSVVVLLALAAIQRIVGFVRGILVCRWLSPDDLGQWDMAFGFLTLAAPLTVLGLPGSFGRYVEHFRQRGQLRTLIRRTAICSGILTVLSVGLIVSARSLFSTIVFGRSNETQLVVVLGISLVAVIVFNYLTELITALRQARVTAVVQFFNSVIFAGVSLLLLWSWRREATALVAAYGFACLVQIVGMLWFLRRQYRALPASQANDFATVSETDGFWSRLLPFAAWVWVCNLLYNLFDVADRYMIVHTSRADDPLAVVGSYHSSRIVPLLLVSIAALLGTVILPHLSHDWEAGRRNEVSARMNLTLKLLGLLLFVGSIAILLAAPFLFNVAFNGKFRGGMDVLPWTLAYCAWFGMVTMAQMYLWCAERARLSCLALFIGLVTNVGLNLILLPRFGLAGAVWATAAANFIALALIYRFNAWLGMKIERSLLLVSLLPLTLGLGLLTAIATLAAVIVAIIATDQILSRDEKRRLAAVWQSYAHRLPIFRSPRLAQAPWPGGIVKPSPALPVWGPGLNNGKDEAQFDSTDAALKSSARPLRVMFVITSMHVGGAETLLLNLLRRIDRSRFSPELCCLKELGELGEQLQHEIPVYEKLLRNKFDIGVFWRLTKLLRRRQIDAVVTVGAGDKMFWGRLAARRAGVPVVISALHSTGWPDSITWLNRRLTPLTDAFIAVADRHAKYLVEHEHLPSDRVVVISNGVDTDRYGPNRSGSANLRQQLGIAHSVPLAGIVAVLRPEKNHEMFLRVAARVRRDLVEAHFLIIGDGPRRAELETLVAQLGLTDCVHFLGKRTDVPELLGLLDVFVLTSHNEANPVSILEALASGKPVVSTAVGSIPQTVIDGVTGYLVEPNDELTMARRVSELLLDPAKSQRLGATGRRLVIDNWSLERMVEGYEELLERLYRQKTIAAIVD
jgi:glycosyltransferase involved in cell wall biosynthesis/O-antigen/teichoic acid export membrane protein